MVFGPSWLGDVLASKRLFAKLLTCGDPCEVHDRDKNNGVIQDWERFGRKHAFVTFVGTRPCLIVGGGKKAWERSPWAAFFHKNFA
jgi:hypothetical protein